MSGSDRHSTREPRRHHQGPGQSPPIAHRQPAEPAPERARWPRLVAAPQPRLRPLLPRGYVAFTQATTPRQLVLPATTAVPLVVKLADSPSRPPGFVLGPHSSPILLEGDCAPAYLEVLLSPLGAYRILGLPLNQLSGHTLDLAEVLGRAGRRLPQRLRQTWSWRQRFALVDQFLLERLDRGPQPAPEVGWADQAHLVREFRQFTGTTPTRFQTEVNSIQDAAARSS